MYLPDIDLAKVANVAGSAVALMIATAIFLSWMTARYVPAFDRYRALTGELRGLKEQSRRRDSLRKQIEDYRVRLKFMSRATDLLCAVMICAIVTIVLASSSVAFPPKEKLSNVQDLVLKCMTLGGALTLLTALILDLIAICLVAIENHIDRRSIEAEVMDIDEVSGGKNV
jgi:hypothetical protein